MMTRRQLIENSAFMAAGCRLARGWAPATYDIRLGAQTNAWPIGRLDTFLGVLDQIKQLGYAGFETGF